MRATESHAVPCGGSDPLRLRFASVTAASDPPATRFIRHPGPLVLNLAPYKLLHLWAARRMARPVRMRMRHATAQSHTIISNETLDVLSWCRTFAVQSR